MTMVLQKLSFLSVVDGTEVCPARDDLQLATQVKAWDKKDLNAKLELLLHMMDMLKQSIRTVTTFKEMFKVRSVAHRVNYLQQLFSLWMKESDSPKTFLQ
ncbi:hypothetical protein KP509_1Z208800 [Ceratopteris richardii]|nr:hypothetical protein KP509_1Z208800 [Ceratopteris richardii]